jgi:hypothetical protein
VKRFNRRTFINKTLHGTAGALAGSLVGIRADASAGLAPPSPCPPTAWEKHGVILRPTEPWEGGRIQNFTCPAEPLDNDRWRIWYSGTGSPRSFSIGYAEGVLGGSMKKCPARLSAGDPPDAPLAIGNLPKDWKPVQVIHIRLRNGRHRMYFWAHGPSIVRYLAAESDDGRRYRVVTPHRPVLYHPNDRAAHGVPTPDGVVLRKEQSASRPADEPLAPSHLISNDATNVYQLPDGSFEMYSVGLVRVAKDDPAFIAHDNAAGLVRVIDRYVSEDGIRFEQRKRVIQPDANDPADQQCYYLAVTHTPKGRVGMLGHYRVEAQTMDIEWCFSPDGLTWQRPLRKAWLPRGDKTRPDSYGVYSANHLVAQGGQYHLFYTGVNVAHNGKHSHGPRQNVVMHATADSIWASEG